MGFRTRVQLPPGPLIKIALNPAISRVERFFLFAEILIIFGNSDFKLSRTVDSIEANSNGSCKCMNFLEKSVMIADLL